MCCSVKLLKNKRKPVKNHVYASPGISQAGKQEALALIKPASSRRISIMVVQLPSYVPHECDIENIYIRFCLGMSHLPLRWWGLVAVVASAFLLLGGVTAGSPTHLEYCFPSSLFITLANYL